MPIESSMQSPETSAPTDDQVVREAMSQLEGQASNAEHSPEALLEQQRQLAWERDRARIEDFFNRPGSYIGAFWQDYKPIAITLVTLAIALFALNFTLSIIGFIVGIPLLGGLLELIGLGYSIWFVKRYLLTAESRQALGQKIEEIKQAVIGTTEEVVGDSSLTAKKSVMIQKSPEDLFRFWRNFENLPSFMNHLESVKVFDDKRSHWVAKAPLDTIVEWDAEIIDETPNQSIVWKSLPGAQVESTGSVTFTSMNGSGTEVQVTLKYNPPAGVVGSMAASVFGEHPQQQLDEDLERFKQAMEASVVSSMS